MMVLLNEFSGAPGKLLGSGQACKPAQLDRNRCEISPHNLRIQMIEGNEIRILKRGYHTNQTINFLRATC
jgi:hypothetical protein